MYTRFFLLPFLLLYLFIPSTRSYPLVLATIATSSADLLPARITLLSAKTAGSLPRHTVLTLLTTPAVPNDLAEAIAKHDQIDHVRLSHQSSRFPLLSLFRLHAEKVLFLSQYTLVTHSLSPLFHCPSFCASFITPCSFSSSLMVLAPNPTTHTALTRIADNLHHPFSPCRHPPDWLSPEACILNHHFADKLITAPLFYPDSVSPNASIPPPQPNQLSRLPMGCHVPHHLYYPRFQWEVPVTPCGIQRAVDFQSPRLLRPWYWWTYLFMNLASHWRAQRLQLVDSHTIRQDRIHFISSLTVLTCIAAIASLVAARSFNAAEWRALKSDHKHTVKPLPEPVLVLYVVTLGGLACLLSWTVAFLATPPMLTPPLALPLVISYRVVTQTILWVALGYLFIKHHAIPADNRHPRTNRRAALETFWMVVADMVSFSIALHAANSVAVETMYDRLGLLAVAGFSYICMVLWLLGRLCVVWVSVGVKDWLL